MPRIALVIELRAKVGQKETLTALLRKLRSMVAIEPGNPVRAVVRLDPRTFAVF